MTRAQFWWLVLLGYAFFAFALLTMCSAARADPEPRREREPASACRPNTLPQSVVQVKLTIGQFHFFEGVWATSPLTPEGLPPGDGGLMAYNRGQGPSTAFILITRGDEICGVFPMRIGEIMLKLLDEIKDGPGEKL
jgi:hypothetical protein